MKKRRQWPFGKMAARLLMFWAVAGSGSNYLVQLAAADDQFNLAAPSDTSNLTEQIFWATQYYISSDENSALPIPQAYPFLGRGRANLGAAVKERGWCNAALEGTASVHFTQNARVTYNYRELDPDRYYEQANCVKFFPHLAAAAAMTRTLFIKTPADASYGLGDKTYYRLVPFRSIAVDRAVFPAQGLQGRRHFVFFIPKLRGAQFVAPNGTTYSHDGYVMAADTGGAIKGQHIDVFTGDFSGNFAPYVIQSRPSATFKGFVVRDSGVINTLRDLHVRFQ